MASVLSRKIGQVALITLFLLPCGRLHSQSLSVPQKIDRIFDYAETCRWLKPSDCANLDPNFADLSPVAPYRNLCGDQRPAACLQDGLIPAGDAAGPLPLETFRLLEVFIAAAKSVCNLDQGVQGCIDEDRAARQAPNWPWERDRRLVRTLAAKDPQEWYVFWPWLLARYAAFCGMHLDPQSCLESFAPRRPSSGNAEINAIFNFAESCHWLKPAACANRDPSFNDIPAVAPYRQLCEEASPAQCLLNKNLLPSPVANRQPLSLDLFRSLESIVYNARAICNLMTRSYAACRNEDLSRPEDRRLVRDLWALDEKAFTFMPWMLGRYLGFCGQNWDIPTCLAYFAPQRPVSTQVLLSGIHPEALREAQANASLRIPPSGEGIARTPTGNGEGSSPEGGTGTSDGEARENPEGRLGEPPRAAEPNEASSDRPFHPDLPASSADNVQDAGVAARPPRAPLPQASSDETAKSSGAVAGGACSLGMTQATPEYPSTSWLVSPLLPWLFISIGIRRHRAKTD